MADETECVRVYIDDGDDEYFRCRWWFDSLQSLCHINPTIAADKLVTILHLVLTTDPLSVRYLPCSKFLKFKF